MGSHIVVLSDSDVATDLLDQRSVVYGDRVGRPFDIPSRLRRLPARTLAPASHGERTVSYVLSYSSVTTLTNHGRMGCSWSIPTMHYGSLWRTHRRLFHRFFNASAASQFDDKIHKAVGVFLRRLSESPECFLNHACLYVDPRSVRAQLRVYYVPFDWEVLPGP